MTTNSDRGESRFSALVRIESGLTKLGSNLVRLEKHMETLARATVATQEKLEEDAAEFERLFRGLQQSLVTRRCQIRPT